MLPFPNVFGNGLNPTAKGILAQPKQSTCFQNPIRRGLSGAWILSEKANQAGPK